MPDQELTVEARVAVTQADRDMAADYGRATAAVSSGEARAIRRGEWDDLPRVLWFARHRQSQPDLLAQAVAKLLRELGNAVEIQPSLRALVDYDECQRIAREALNLCWGGEDDPRL